MLIMMVIVMKLTMRMVMLMPVIGLMLQPDLGNSVLTLLVMISLLFLSALPLRILFSAGCLGIGVIAYSILNHPYQLARVRSFFHPWADPLGENYHIIQSFTAIGSGGMFGFGIGESRLKYFYLPLHYF